MVIKFQVWVAEVFFVAFVNVYLRSAKMFSVESAREERRRQRRALSRLKVRSSRPTTTCPIDALVSRENTNRHHRTHCLHPALHSIILLCLELRTIIFFTTTSASFAHQQSSRSTRAPTYYCYFITCHHLQFSNLPSYPG